MGIILSRVQLTVGVFCPDGVPRLAGQRDALLVDGAHLELVEVARAEALHGGAQVVGVGLKGG